MMYDATDPSYIEREYVTMHVLYKAHDIITIYDT